MKVDEMSLVDALATVAEELLAMVDSGTPFPPNSAARREAVRVITDVKFLVVGRMRPWSPPPGKDATVSAPLIYGRRIT